MSTRSKDCRSGRWSVFSKIDLKDAYYKIPVQEDDQKYYAFEAAGKLYGRKRLTMLPKNWQFDWKTWSGDKFCIPR